MDSSGGNVLDKYNEQEQKLEEEISKYIELNWREVNCQRNVGDSSDTSSNFSNGSSSCGRVTAGHTGGRAAAANLNNSSTGNAPFSPLINPNSTILNTPNN